LESDFPRYNQYWCYLSDEKEIIKGLKKKKGTIGTIKQKGNAIYRRRLKQSQHHNK